MVVYGSLFRDIEDGGVQVLDDTYALPAVSLTSEPTVTAQTKRMWRKRFIPIAVLLLALLTACTAPSVSSGSNAPASPIISASPVPSVSASAATATTPITLPTFVQLSAPSTNVVWALVGGIKLFRSTDRGDTWQERPLPTNPLQNAEIAFVGDSEGWTATPGSPGTQCTFQSVGIAHTVNAGSTWDQVVLASSSSSSGIADRQCKQRLTFADAQRGFLTAYDPNGPPAIYRTTDGGRTWTASRPLPDPPGFTTRGAGVVLRVVGVRAVRATLLLAAQAEVNGQGVWYVYRSNDGGASWSYAVTLPATLGTFAFITETRWLQIAPASASTETTDGGATWHAFASDYSQAAGVAPTVVFADALVGYATVRGAIQRTVDGGAHWVGIKTPGI